ETPARRSTPRPDADPVDGRRPRPGGRDREETRGRGRDLDVEDLREPARSRGGDGGSGGPGGRSGRGRSGGEDRRGDGRSTRSVGMLERTDVDDEPGADDAQPDKLAWLKHGWFGPLAIALVVSLLAVGLYAMLSGGDETPTENTPAPATPPATASQIPTGT